MDHRTQSCVGSKNTGKKAYQLKTSVREMVKYGQGSLGLSGALRDEERASQVETRVEGVPVGSAKMRSRERAGLGLRALGLGG